MINPRNTAIISMLQEDLEEFENYLLVYQSKKLVIKGSNTLNFEECYEKEMLVEKLPVLLTSITCELFNTGIDKVSIYKTSTGQKLLGCTILIPECEVQCYYESGPETYQFGEQLSTMLRYTFSLA